MKFSDSPIKTDEELKEIALAYYRNEIFTDRNCKSEDDVFSVFLVISLMEQEDILDLQEADVDFFYEYLNKATSKTINGMPTFTSCNFLRKSETEKMIIYYDEIRKRVKI